MGKGFCNYLIFCVHVVHISVCLYVGVHMFAHVFSVEAKDRHRYLPLLSSPLFDLCVCLVCTFAGACAGQGSMLEVTACIEARAPRAHIFSQSKLLMSKITGGAPHPPNTTWMLKSSSCPCTFMATSALLSCSPALLSSCLETGPFCDPWTKF